QKRRRSPASFSFGVVRGLEVKASLQLNHARTECAARLAEVGLLDVTLNTVPSASTVEVDLVKQVVEIGANLNFAVLANQFHVWQTKRLAELRVDVEVSRSCERIACNSRNGRQPSERLLPPSPGRPSP